MIYQALCKETIQEKKRKEKETDHIKVEVANHELICTRYLGFCLFLSFMREQRKEVVIQEREFRRQEADSNGVER